MGSNTGRMVLIIGWQTLIHAIAETDVLEPDLHMISLTHICRAVKTHLDVRICVTGSSEVLKQVSTQTHATPRLTHPEAYR